MIQIFYYDGKVKRATVDDLKNIRDKPIWLDVNNLTEEEQAFISKEFDLHPLTADDLYNSGVRVKVENFQNYLFLVFYGVVHEGSIRMLEIDFVLGDNFLISNHRHKNCTHDEIKMDLDKIEAAFKNGVDFLMYKLLDLEIDNFVPVLDKVGDEIEDLEAAITKQASPELLGKVLENKRRLARIKKFTTPQREKMGLLTKADQKFISKKTLPYLRDVHDHSIRISDSIESHKEALGNTFDLYMSSVSNSTNEVMKVLSVMATIALPLTVISGVYGTNFANLPGSQASLGFWAMVMFMVMLSATMIAYFKWRNWF